MHNKSRDEKEKAEQVRHRHFASYSNLQPLLDLEEASSLPVKYLNLHHNVSFWTYHPH